MLASIICCTRYTLEANVEISILPFMLVKMDLILSPIFLSDTENLSTKAFVLSERRHNTPLSPSSVIFEYSV